jgi:regulator of RNase E activity RraA
MAPYPYKIPIKEMVRRYERVPVAVIHDALQARNLHNQWLGPDVKCLTKDLREEVVAGFAFTVQWVFDPRPDERDRPAAKMVESYPEDGIIVVDTGADQVSGFWGDLATTVCLRNGVKGAVINGGAKDIGVIKTMGFPIFARFSTPVDGFYRSRLRDWQIPIWFKDVLVRPGDFIVGDADGVVVVPQEIAEEVLAQGEKQVQSEGKIRESLKKGTDADKASRVDGRKDL